MSENLTNIASSRRTTRAPRKNSLAIVERAFRGTVEEQYGHIVWLSGVMRAMNAEHSLLLRGPAVLFAVADQVRQDLRIGDLHLTGLPNYELMVRSLVQNGGPVYVHARDVERYGIQSRLMAEVTQVDEAGVIALYEAHYHVWYW